MLNNSSLACFTALQNGNNISSRQLSQQQDSAAGQTGMQVNKFGTSGQGLSEEIDGLREQDLQLNGIDELGSFVGEMQVGAVSHTGAHYYACLGLCRAQQLTLRHFHRDI